jgi:hypothetical protein
MLSFGGKVIYIMVYFEPFVRENCHEFIKKALYLVKLDGNAASS